MIGVELLLILLQEELEGRIYQLLECINGK